ncbi:ScyD/ScyE family protein [Leifsonia kafniensis]|uniref:ScyD/ScyE family protein n=1 Tax=Leifsonia kafniensis TaxID=475957 RepID=A0ABP7K6W3_9MICO
MKKTLFIAAVSAFALAAMTVAAPALADGRDRNSPPRPGSPVTLTDGLISPLSLAVQRDGTAYTTQNFIGQLTRVTRDGTASVAASAPGQELSAVSERNGTVYYAQNAMDHSSSALMEMKDGGAPTPLADLWAYENSENPDQINTYGFEGLPQSCADQFDASAPPFLPASYTGTIDTHAYGSVALDDAVYVADAGANAILRVGYDGTVSTTAVLPPADPVVATADVVAQFGFPACAAGHDYRFEPVPTDVELGPDGWLYVSSLPGGPESAALGARGSVVKIDPDSGEIVKVASGFVGTTGLAVSPTSGTVYVAELFGGPTGTGQISVVKRGASTPTVLMALSSPAAIELRSGSLYVTTDAFVPDATGNPQPIGKVTIVPLRGSGSSEDCDDPGHGNHGGNGHA